MFRTLWLRTACLSALCLAFAAVPAMAGSTAPVPFSTSHGKSSVPVTPRQTVSKTNRSSGIVFNNKRSLKTRNLTSGQLSKTDKTLANIKASTAR